MRPQFSISLRLTMWFGSIFLLGWVLFGASMWWNLARTLKGERSQTLGRRIDRLQELLAKDRTAAGEDRVEDFREFAHATGNGLSEVMRESGERALPSPSEAAAAFPWPAVSPGRKTLFETVRSSGQSYWVMARPFALGDERLVLMAAAPEAGNLVVLQSFLGGLLASVPVLLLVSSAGGYWMSRRALKPVDRITTTARSIGIRNISERIPVERTGDELQRLAETCNGMLDRLEASVNQMKRFTADASHELRGPLSFTRTVAEVALNHAGADAESRRALAEIVDEMAKAAVLLDEMLTLARADAAPAGVPRTQVDLRGIVEEVCGMARGVASQSGLELSLEQAKTPCVVLGDAAALKRLLWILLDNAVKYSKAGGRIAVSVKGDGGLREVSVRDDGIGIAAADLPRIFDRFYRADPSRSMVEGNGLGLAIARWIAETHEAELRAVSELGQGTCFTVAFAAAV
jgi:heavy metal sensor kinase